MWGGQSDGVAVLCCGVCAGLGGWVRGRGVADVCNVCSVGRAAR